jgi:small subunit ribosomal protein S17
MADTRRLLDGTVVSTKMQKTVVVSVERSRRHPLYEKIVRTRKKYLAHDEDEVCQEGDVVRIRESRPLSRRKRWRVVEVVRRGGRA